MSQATKSKPRLGRGLSSLISVSHLPVEAEIGDNPASAALALTQAPRMEAMESPQALGGPLVVAVDAIRPNPHQPRKTINEAGIADLAASLKSSGIIQPLVVRRAKIGFEIIAGQRRLQAAKVAGLTEVPVIVRDVDSYTQAQMALVENIQREDLNPIERAQGYQGADGSARTDAGGVGRPNGRGPQRHRELSPASGFG